MREIEIKARLDDVASIVTAIAKQGGKLTEPVSHHDRVYGVPGTPGASANNDPWLRIRGETRGGSTKFYFTLKKSITNQLDSIEHETVISDDKELAKIIEHLNFVPYSDLTKTRRKAMLGDVEVCVDHVDQLGDFIELEKLTAEDADYNVVVKELWEILESLGVPKSREVTDGYDVLLNKHLGIE
ncbi:class IV adenylate cyclase [Candidatus Saccharibacteria bacterium]|nr:class IV adenylate cyclase [Candidatus Saccharibacteria bacterium]